MGIIANRLRCAHPLPQGDVIRVDAKNLIATFVRDFLALIRRMLLMTFQKRMATAGLPSPFFRLLWIEEECVLYQAEPSSCITKAEGPRRVGYEMG